MMSPCTPYGAEMGVASGASGASGAAGAAGVAGTVPMADGMVTMETPLVKKRKLKEGAMDRLNNWL